MCDKSDVGYLFTWFELRSSKPSAIILSWFAFPTYLWSVVLNIQKIASEMSVENMVLQILRRF